jgi:hypothetical protein
MVGEGVQSEEVKGQCGRRVYIQKRINSHFKEGKPTWRSRPAASTSSCSCVRRELGRGLKQLVPGVCRFGRCQSVKRRSGCDTKLQTIRPTTALGKDPGQSGSK